MVFGVNGLTLATAADSVGVELRNSSDHVIVLHPVVVDVPVLDLVHK